MLGLARLAWCLAGERCPNYGSHFIAMWAPVPRKDVLDHPNANPVSAEYYRIIDRITKGEQP